MTTMQPIRQLDNTYNVTEGLAKIFVDNSGRVGEDYSVLLVKNRRSPTANFRYTLIDENHNFGLKQMHVNLDEANLLDYAVTRTTIPIYHYGETHLVQTNNNGTFNKTNFAVPPGFPEKPHHSLVANVLRVEATTKVKVTFSWEMHDTPIRTSFADLASEM